MQTDMFVLQPSLNTANTKPNYRVDFIGQKPLSLREAIDISIAKWEFIRDALVADKDVTGDGGTSTCGLCMLYYHENCKGCPIYNEGHYQCDGTPYDDFEDDGGKSNFHAAQREIAFLISLRDKYCGDNNHAN